MTDCIFCKIIAGEIPGNFVYKDNLITAFRDINPAAPVHILVIPNKHIPSVNEITDKDELLLGKMMLAVKQIVQNEGIAEDGYRLIVNTGLHSNQLVPHLHIHILGGREMIHPMG